MKIKDLLESRSYVSHAEFDDVVPAYARLQDTPSTEWMPDMDGANQDQPYKVSFQYSHTEASGDDERNVEISGARVYDERKHKWVPITDIAKVFGTRCIPEYEDRIADSLR